MLLSAAGRPSSSSLQHPPTVPLVSSNPIFNQIHQTIQSDHHPDQQATESIDQSNKQATQITNESVTLDWEHVSNPISPPLVTPDPPTHDFLVPSTKLDIEIHQPEKDFSTDDHHQPSIHQPRISSLLKTWLEQLPPQPDMLSNQASSSVLDQEEPIGDLELPSLFRKLVGKMDLEDYLRIHSASVSNQNAKQDDTLFRFVGSDLGPEDSASQVLSNNPLITKARSPISFNVNQIDHVPLDLEIVKKSVDEKMTTSSIDRALLQRFNTLRDSHFGPSLGDGQEPASIDPFLTGDILECPATMTRARTVDNLQCPATVTPALIGDILECPANTTRALTGDILECPANTTRARTGDNLQCPATLTPALTGDKILGSPSPDAGHVPIQTSSPNTLPVPSPSPALTIVDPSSPEKNSGQTPSSRTKADSTFASFLASFAIAVALGLVALLLTHYYHLLPASLIEKEAIRSVVSSSSWDLSAIKEDEPSDKIKLDVAFEPFRSLMDKEPDEEVAKLDEKEPNRLLLSPSFQAVTEMAKDSISSPSSSPALVRDSTNTMPPSFSPALGQDSSKFNWALITWIGFGGVTLVWISFRAKIGDIITSPTQSPSCPLTPPQQSHPSSRTSSYAVDLLIQFVRDEQTKRRKTTNLPCPEKIENLLKEVASNPTLLDLFGNRLLSEGSKSVKSGIGGFFTWWVQKQRSRQRKRKKKEIGNDVVEVKEEEEEAGVWAEAIRCLVESRGSNSEVDIKAKISEEEKEPEEMMVVKPEESDDEITVVGARRSSSLSRRRSTRSRSRSIAVGKTFDEPPETIMCGRPVSSSSSSSKTTTTTKTKTKREKSVERSGSVLEKKSPRSSSRSRKKVATGVKAPVRSSPRNKPLVKYNEV